MRFFGQSPQNDSNFVPDLIDLTTPGGETNQPNLQTTVSVLRGELDFLVSQQLQDKLFWYKWSSSFHYIYVNHNPDCITLISDNFAAGPAGSESECRTNINPFKPEVLMCNSKWSSQVFDWSLNYAISPDFKIGGLIQIPVRRKSAYRSSTFMLSLFINI